MTSPRKRACPLKPFLGTANAHALADYLKSLPSETLVSLVRIEERRGWSQFDSRKSKHVKATLKQWDADAKVAHDKRKQESAR